MNTDRPIAIKAAVPLIVLLLTGCGVLPSVGPDYEAPPQMGLPEKWKNDSPHPDRLGEELKVHSWWKVLADENLNLLISKAIENNRQLDIAESRVREAKESRRSVVGGFFPQIGIGGGVTRNKISGNTLQGRLFGGSAGVNFPLAQTTYDGGFDASWEIDLFGGLRREYEAAEATVSAVEEQMNDVLVVLTSEVARTYYETLAIEKRLSIAKDNSKIQTESLEIVQSRVNAGLSSELDLSQAKAQLETTKASVPTLEALSTNSRARLAVLLGESLEGFEQKFPRPSVSSATMIVKDLPPGILEGVPSDVLRNRPDIRSAERNLAAETARVGVAMAELFPKFSLTGSFRLQSITSQNFLDAASKAWNIGPAVSLPIFTAGRLTAQLRAQNERASQATSQYEQIVLEALAEAESSLSAFEQEKIRYLTLRNAYDSSSQALYLSKELYQKGLVDFLRVIEAQRAVFAAGELLAISEQQMVSNLIASYKALGYGWAAEPITVAAVK